MSHGARTPDLCVVGAGVMGTWTALEAVERGLDVLLVDAFGPGDPRATSGDENRILRSSHGLDRVYPVWARESRLRWLELGEEAGAPIFSQAGTAWFARDEAGFEADSEATLRSLGIPVEHLTPAEAAGRWPIATDDLAFVLFEPEAGVLRARAGVRAAARAFERRGGRLVRARVRPIEGSGAQGTVRDQPVARVVSETGERFDAGAFVFACGPWLPALFPDTVGDLIRVTRQDVLYVGTPAGDASFDTPGFPAWVDYAEAFYGLPATDGRGAKLAPDWYGPPTDPDHLDRIVAPESVEATRAVLRRRLPRLADAPIVETRVCQYETTPDTHWVIDRHPAMPNAWIVGGGSGHGFKHGPRIGRYVVDRVTGAVDDPELARRFALDRPRETGPGMRSAAAAR